MLFIYLLTLESLYASQTYMDRQIFVTCWEIFSAPYIKKFRSYFQPLFVSASQHV